MYLALGDKYGNVVGNTNTAKITLRVDTAYDSKDPRSKLFSPVLEGQLQYEVKAGSVDAANITFSGTPGQKYSKNNKSKGYN